MDLPLKSHSGDGFGDLERPKTLEKFCHSKSEKIGQVVTITRMNLYYCSIQLDLKEVNNEWGKNLQGRA